MSLSSSKIKRFFNKLTAADFGIIASVVTVICELLALITIILIGEYENGLYELLIAAVNIIFYISIGRYFLRGKQYDDMRSIAMAIGILALFDYIIPAIRSLIGGFALSGFEYAAFGGLVLSGIFGILYFVFLLLEMRRKIRNPYIYLIIFGALILAGSVLDAAGSIYVGVAAINSLNELALEEVNLAPYILSIIALFLSVISSVGFGLTYLLYPILKERRSNRGY